MTSPIEYPAIVSPGVARVHYPSGRTSRSALALALLLSLGAHLGVLFGITPAKKPATAQPADPVETVEIIVFKPDDLAETEPMRVDEAAPANEEVPRLPALVDTPTVPKPREFVQPIDLSPLRPSTEKITVIPAKFTRSEGPGRETIFNPGDLDRRPVAIAQPAPPYPHLMRREALTATVVVGFIVDASGSVVNVHVVDSTHPGFNDAAVTGVAKWRFRPGMRGGRKVNARMHVPIVFRLADGP